MSNSCEHMDCSLPESLSRGFSTQEYWSGLPVSSLGDLPTQNWTWVSCIAGRFFTNWATREAQIVLVDIAKSSIRKLDLFTSKLWVPVSPQPFSKRVYFHTLKFLLIWLFPCDFNLLSLVRVFVYLFICWRTTLVAFKILSCLYLWEIGLLGFLVLFSSILKIS